MILAKQEVTNEKLIQICEHDFDPMRKLTIIVPKIKLELTIAQALLFAKKLELEATKLLLRQ